jgi:hypothetical protein
MRRAVVLCGLLAGCGGGGGVSNHDPARYGAVPLSPGPLSGNVATWRRIVGGAAAALDALGPDFKEATAGDDQAAVIFVDARALTACGVPESPTATYVAATRTLTIEVCPSVSGGVASDTRMQSFVMHALGHVVGMGHVGDSDAVMNGPLPGTTPGRSADWSELFMAMPPTAVTQADIDEFKRTHP